MLGDNECDAADRLAQALRDLITEAVEAAATEQQPPPPSTPRALETELVETWLSRKQVAERLRIPVGTLAAWASEGRGPKYYKFGKWTRYRLSELMAWEDEQICG
jgi:hypothetical protein